VSDLQVTPIILASIAVLFIGLSKAGFGGGLGMLTTPLTILACNATGRTTQFGIGVLLPLLCLGDAFTMYHYWGKWEKRNLAFLLPGIVVGVIFGARLIGQANPRQLNVVVGALAVGFVVFQFVKEKLFRAEGTFKPNHWIGFPFGFGAGLTSAFAHGAGPVVSLFLIPQKLSKEFYVGTTILIFSWINWIKIPFFAANHVITTETLWFGLKLAPLIPLGVWLGVWLNRKVPERHFAIIVYVSTFLTGLQLIFNFDWAAIFGGTH
jgi:uncharacterized membrane protein YfcA